MKTFIAAMLLTFSAGCVHTPEINPSYACGDADLPRSAVETTAIAALLDGPQQLAQVRRCYEADLKRDDHAKGKVKVIMSVDGTGNVRRACVANGATTYVADGLHACLLSHIRSWHFSRPYPTTPISYTFSFDPLAPVK